jgi:hypothetical protein
VKVFFYDAATGIFTGRSLDITDHEGAAIAIKNNTPAGQKAFAGDADVLAERVDLETGKLVDYQPPQPSDAHEWETAVRRWRLNPEVAAAQEARRAARAQLHAVEQSQGRAIREAVLGQPGALERLRALDEQIEKLRALL